MLKNGNFCEIVILVVFKGFLLVKNLEILIQIVPDSPIYYNSQIHCGKREGTVLRRFLNKPKYNGFFKKCLLEKNHFMTFYDISSDQCTK